jgi:predicted small lipoprotein YifL
MNAKTLAVFIASSLLLAGCGNKGPLVLPPAPVVEDALLPEDATPDTDAEAAPQVEPDNDPDVDAVEADEPSDPPAPADR